MNENIKLTILEECKKIVTQKMPQFFPNELLNPPNYFTKNKRLIPTHRQNPHSYRRPSNLKFLIFK